MSGDPQAPTAHHRRCQGRQVRPRLGLASRHGTSFDALVAPFLIDSYELEAKVLESPIAADALDGLDSLGVVGVGIQPGPLKLLSGSTHAFLRPEDFAGATVAIGP